MTDNVEMVTFTLADQSNRILSHHVQTLYVKTSFELTIESMNKYFMPVIILYHCRHISTCANVHYFNMYRYEIQFILFYMNQ
jgi:hypothetical protein